MLELVIYSFNWLSIKSKGNEKMDGILIVNKPKEYTSHDVVAKVKKIYGVKVGHTGTLDPMATGVLPLLLGEGTKLCAYLTDHSKIYEATIKLGIQTDTADSEGEIINKKQVNQEELEISNVQKVLQSFLGKQRQIPPMYSAIKINGKKLYEYARQGKQIEIPEREIEIHQIDLLNISQEEKTITYRVHCSKGTYIRSLCEDIAKKLNTIGYMQELNRIQVGKFSLEQAIALQELEQNKENKEFLESKVITLKEFFRNSPSICLEEKKLTLFLNGVQLTKKEQDGFYQITNEQGKWIGVGIIENQLLKRKLII